MPKIVAYSTNAPFHGSKGYLLYEYVIGDHIKHVKVPMPDFIRKTIIYGEKIESEGLGELKQNLGAQSKPFLCTRSVKKAISWRIIALIFTIVTALVLTGSIKIASSIGVVDIMVKTFIYWLHEEIWNNYE